MSRTLSFAVRWLSQELLPRLSAYISVREYISKKRRTFGFLDDVMFAHTKKDKGSPYSITERRVPDLIPVLGSQPAGDVNRNPTVGCHYFPPGLQLPPQPLRGLLPMATLIFTACSQVLSI